ncbi:MAG: hypothetical protein LBO71_09565 [Prevotellaceae bacterium]|jgi:hypothetical protein|nr:hypothetical protein [Prevotellaceae bacterium]
MKNRKTYEEAVRHLAQVAPVLEDSEALAQNIMAQIEYVAQNQPKYRALRTTGVLSGVAACLLLCLLMYDAAQLTLLRQDEAKAATASTARQVRRGASGWERACATGDIQSEKMKIAEAIKEKLAARSRKERRYSAYLCSMKIQNNLKK